jgi:Tfp pilus assembly PilM family ATPase
VARFLALDWDAQQFQVVMGTAKHGRLHIHQAFAREEKQLLTAATARTLGQALRQHLKAERMAPAPVLACVPRERLVLREIHFPPVAPAEEPALVRFQTLKELTTPPDQVVIDYVCGGEPGPNGERRALVVIMPRDLLATYRELCQAAGLKLAALVPRPFGTAACLNYVVRSGLPGPAQPGATVAVLTVADRWAEFCLVKGGELLLARTLAPPGADGETALLGEIRRNLAVYAGQVSHSPVQALYVAAAGRHSSVTDRLGTTLAIPVHSLDPFAGLTVPNLPTENRGAFAAAVGLIQAQTERRAVPINFIQPKEPKPARDPTKRRAIAAAAVVAFLTIGTGVWGYSLLASRDRQLKELNVIKIGLDGQLLQLEEDDLRIKAVSDWVKNNVNWLDELYDLTDRFPEGNAMRLTYLAGEPLAHTVKETHVGRITLKGIAAADYKEVDALIAWLRLDGHYRVEPKILGRNLSIDRFRFPNQFSTRVDVEKREPAQYLRRLSVEPPRRQRQEPPAFDFGAPGGDLP